MTRVVIIDDHLVVREGVKRILSTVATEFAVVGEAADGEEALKVLRNTPCDVVLLDISLPRLDGFEVLKVLKAEMPHMLALILSIGSEDEYAHRALRLGAAGYLTKNSAVTDLVAALRKVVRGGRYVSPSLAEKLALGTLDGMNRPVAELLSPREYQILSMISAGKRIGDIANDLHLSVKTISTYRSRILEKLSLRNTAEITRYAIKHEMSEQNAPL